MLRTLSIRDVALIESVDLEFSEGMTVFLGETGAGKSIIMDALALALGGRAPSDTVRKGARKAIVECTFGGNAPGRLANTLRAEGLDAYDDSLVLRREVTASGTTRSFINDSPVPLQTVRTVASLLMDFHGQHDTHGLLDSSTHCAILDSLAGLQDDVQEMADAWQTVLDARKSFHDLQERAKTADFERSRLHFIIQDIESVNPSPGEDSQVAADLLRGESSESIVAAATTVRDRLYGGDMSAYDQLSQAVQALSSLAGLIPELHSHVEELESARVACREIAGDVARFADPEDFSAERLEELRLRQSQLQRLIRKYGSLDSAREEYVRATMMMSMLENVDELLVEAESAVERATASALKKANILSEKRKKTFPRLVKSVNTSLALMGMKAATLIVANTMRPLGANGIDDVAFHFSANPGEQPRPLDRIASGGELSRLMLALKRAIAERGSVGTMIFDEIDTGISGRIATTVGAVMHDLSARHQIFCITHLAQIAAYGSAFVRVEKRIDGGTTRVEAVAVPRTMAVDDIALLMSGSTVTASTRTSAEELMNSVLERLP
jgi:DNA repair protein RecN (Recombination protein N)